MSNSFECGLKKVMFEDVEFKPSGDCSIRMNAWLTKVDYSTMFLELKEWARKKYSNNVPRNYASPTCVMGGMWREHGVWYMPLLNRGYKILSLNKHMQIRTLAKKLKDIKYAPFCVLANNHVAVLEDGNVVDTWDSRHKVIKRIVVKEEEVNKMKKALNCDDVTEFRMKRDHAPKMN